VEAKVMKIYIVWHIGDYNSPSSKSNSHWVKFSDTHTYTT